MSVILATALVLGVSLLASVVVGELLAIAWGVRRPREGVHPWASLAPALVVAVPLTAVIVGATALLPARPSVWLEGRCACEAFGGLHVCPLHLTRAKLFVLAVTLAALVLHVPRLRGLVAAWQRIKDIEHLASAAGPERDGIVLVEDGGRPLVFVAGLRRPRLFVERTWWASLERRERDVIAAHERAHIDARDSWTLLTLDLILSLVSPRVRRAILADFPLNAELCADAEAARSDGDPVFVAEVLCRYARAARPAVTAGFGSGDLETRVRSLVGEPTRAPPRRAARARGLTVTMAVCACLLGHLSHRALETLLNALI